MPIYEYECNSCAKVIEVVQRISEGPLTICPDCHGTLTKLVSKSAFVLKGGGWYADGYGNGTGKGGNGKGNGRNGKSTETPAESPKPASDSASAPAKAATSA